VVAEVVRGELALEAVGGDPVRDGHDPGVVDEQVDGGVPVGEAVREGAHPGQVVEVQGKLNVYSCRSR